MRWRSCAAPLREGSKTRPCSALLKGCKGFAFRNANADANPNQVPVVGDKPPSLDAFDRFYLPALSRVVLNNRAQACGSECGARLLLGAWAARMPVLPWRHRRSAGRPQA